MSPKINGEGPKSLRQTVGKLENVPESRSKMRNHASLFSPLFFYHETLTSVPLLIPTISFLISVTVLKEIPSQCFLEKGTKRGIIP